MNPIEILLVIDGKLKLSTLFTLLNSCGFKVLTAANGKEALDVLEKNPDCCLVVTDLNMPEMGGKELLKTLRKNQNYIYCIILCPGREQSLEIDLLDCGADALIHVPYEPALVRAQISVGCRILSKLAYLKRQVSLVSG